MIFDTADNGTDLSRGESKRTGEKTSVRVPKPCLGAGSESHPENRHKKRAGKDAATECGRLVSLRRRAVSLLEKGGIADRGPSRVAVPPLVGPTRQQREDHEAAGHIPYRSWLGAVLVWKDVDAVTPARWTWSRTQHSDNHGDRPRASQDKRTFGELQLSPSPILIARASGTRVKTADVFPCKGTSHPWCVQALVRATAAAGIPKVILRSLSEPAIPNLKLQAASECRVKRGMTVIAEDSTE